MYIRDDHLTETMETMILRCHVGQWRGDLAPLARHERGRLWCDDVSKISLIQIHVLLRRLVLEVLFPVHLL